MNSEPEYNQKPSSTPEAAPPTFPIVGVGASAGGLKAFQELLEHLPKNPGLALVLIPHLDPSHGSIMPEILAKSSRMPVREAQEGIAVEVDHVYIIKPDTSITLSGGRLRTAKSRPSPGGGRASIDIFLQSIAKECREKAIGIILSGTASDGAAGIKAIKNEGGRAFAQDDSAEFPGMPTAATATGAVDYVLAPQAIARELIRIVNHPDVTSPTPASEQVDPAEKGTTPFQEILKLLEAQNGVPFLSYKSPTLERRIARRMALQSVEDQGDYLAYLRKNPQELRVLHDELLINVTSFFREPATFDALKTVVYPALLENRPEKSPIRVWVPGCSTGEEAYSLAISLVEFLDERGSGTAVQIFASDVSDPAIAKARAAVYPASITADVSADRLRRFFTATGNGTFQVAKRLRDMVLFARQDITQDPPFSRLDILSCRNVLIYLGAGLHRQVLPLFHYALRPDGFLILGASESADRFGDLFRAVDAKHRIYSKIAGRPYTDRPGLALERHRGPFGAPAHEHATPTAQFDVAREVDRLILGNYGPAGIVVNESGQVIDVRGETASVLRIPPGKPNWSLQRVVREELLADLEIALRQVRETDAPVRREGLDVREDGHFRKVNVSVLPIEGPPSGERYCLILFEETGRRAEQPVPTPVEPREERPSEPGELERENARLRQALATQQDYQQEIIERVETANEELRSSHEEILSANEELQSTNEELQTAKEELQSTNEELLTLNDELRNRNHELTQTNDDLHNVLSSIQIPMAIVDTMLRIRRITPMAEKLLSVVPSNANRRIVDFKPSLDIPNLETLLHTSIDNLSAIEQEVKDSQGKWWLLRIRPYRTIENKIDGAVLTVLDIDELKRSAIQSEERRLFSEALVESMRDPFLVLDGRFTVKQANDSFLKSFQARREEVEGKHLFTMSGGRWEIPALRKLIEEVLPKNTLFKDFQVERDFPGLGRKILLLHARQVKLVETSEPMILLTFEDVTDRKDTEKRTRDLNLGLEHKVTDRTSQLEGAKGELEAFTYSVAHDLRAPLRAMHGFGQTLLEDYAGRLDDKGRMYLEKIVEASSRMDALILDLLTYSRLSREEVPLESVDLEAVVKETLATLASEIDARKAEVEVRGPLPRILAHRTTVGQVLMNLVANAVKFVAPGTKPRVVIRAEIGEDRERIWVEDNGIGIADHHQERIFRVFERLNKMEDYPGTGIGLAIAKKAMDRMYGDVGFESEVGQGSRFWVEFLKDKP